MLYLWKHAEWFTDQYRNGPTMCRFKQYLTLDIRKSHKQQHCTSIVSKRQRMTVLVSRVPLPASPPLGMTQQLWCISPCARLWSRLMEGLELCRHVFYMHSECALKKPYASIATVTKKRVSGFPVTSEYRCLRAVCMRRRVRHNTASCCSCNRTGVWETTVLLGPNWKGIGQHFLGRGVETTRHTPDRSMVENHSSPVKANTERS